MQNFLSVHEILVNICLVLCCVPSYYPLYPSHPDVPVDVEHFDVHCRLPVTPHLLILPSDLRCFIKVTQLVLQLVVTVEVYVNNHCVVRPRST